MGNDYRDDGDGGDVEQPDAYWRRRVITLALGLGLLGILAWGFSGGGGKTTQSSPSSALPATALSTAIPGLASSSPSVASSASPSASGASPAASSTAAAAASATARPQPSANHIASPLAAAGGTRGGAGQGRCGPGSVVLSLFTDRPSYGPSQLPQFQVYAVSTTSASCSFDPGQLQVQVMSSGRIVWDSADCAHASGRPVQLTRGVPAQASVTWDRSITLPGCQLLATAAHAGSYTVQARTVLAGPAVPAGAVQSPVRAFRLSG
jgi:hypothetical protein